MRSPYPTREMESARINNPAKTRVRALHFATAPRCSRQSVRGARCKPRHPAAAGRALHLFHFAKRAVTVGPPLGGRKGQGELAQTHASHIGCRATRDLIKYFQHARSSRDGQAVKGARVQRRAAPPSAEHSYTNAGGPGTHSSVLRMRSRASLSFSILAALFVLAGARCRDLSSLCALKLAAGGGAGEHTHAHAQAAHAAE